MKSSKNPKVLNYIVKNALNPILKKIEQLKQKEIEHDAFIDSAYLKASKNKESITSKEKEYINHENIVRELLTNNLERLSYLIRTKLYNPNLIKEDEGEEPETTPPDNLISTKAINTLSYGFVKSSVSYVMAGIINNGLAIAKETDIQNDFEFINPKNGKFPSFYPNDILKTSTGSAFIATNNGLVDYDFGNEKYLLRTTSYGLNTNIVKRVIPVFNNIGEKSGYVAGTSRGISFSPNGTRWINVDKSFTSEVTSFHTTEHLNTLYDKIFIGTIRGVYFINIANFIENDSLKVIYLEAISDIAPNIYINSIALDVTNDKLYIATDNGVIMVNDISAYIAAGDYKATPPSYKIFNSYSGLSSSACFDIIIMPSLKVCMATANGVTITNNFTNFSYITKKTGSLNTGLESYMCNRIIRKTGNSITVLHPLGFTEGLII
jgi:hypothetical protein